MITGKEFAKTFSEVEDEKLFSTGDAELDGILTEVYYSGIEDGYDYAQKEFADKEKGSSIEKSFSEPQVVVNLTKADIDAIAKARAEAFEKTKGKERRAIERHGKKLENSHRGLGRSVLIGGLPGAIAAYTTKKDVDTDWEKGESEEKIVENAGKRGAKRGAIIGAGASALGAGLSAASLAKAARKGIDLPKAYKLSGVAAIPVAAGLSALSGHLGAKKNARTRLEKSKKSDD